MKEKKCFKIIICLEILTVFCFVQVAFAQQGSTKSLVIDTAKFITTAGGGSERSAAYKDLVAKQFIDLDNNAYIGDPSGLTVLNSVKVIGLYFDDIDFGSAVMSYVNNAGIYAINFSDLSGDARLGNVRANILTMIDAGPFSVKAGGKYVYDIAEGISVLSGGIGDVVVISKAKDLSFTRSTVKFDSKVAGVISTDPKIYMGAGEGNMPLALAGIVKCNVSTENGPVKRGDILVTSSDPGYAMKAEENQVSPGMIVGSALDSLEQGKGKIDILIN